MNNPSSKSIASQWFRAAEATGDFMGIRYGRIPSGNKEVEWSFVSHCECDGIGGFARLLRRHGADLEDLPVTKNSCWGIVGPLWKLWRHKDPESADRRDWMPDGPPGEASVAWHLFTEEETHSIKERCRKEGISVNSFLLKHLDQAIRPETRKPEAAIPWMIPVNLRGDLSHKDDTENHVSYIEPRISANSTASEIQEQIRQRLSRGEHRANYLILGLGRFMRHQTKVDLIAKDRTLPAGNIGAFSNLGAWDSEKTIETKDSWLFCPPVVNGQLLGAGCVTFQNRLSLTVQSNSVQAGVVDTWMTRWLKAINSA